MEVRAIGTIELEQGHGPVGVGHVVEDGGVVSDAPWIGYAERE